MLLLIGLILFFQNVHDFESQYATALWWCRIKLSQVRRGVGIKYAIGGIRTKFYL
jgi:hypothetical protein